ncbi:hypothetical protein [Tenacibaculum sp. 190524A05c]|uniref:hypothetical protein n=1 Tax=Tenacibaculum platacis TaxID=3137852 RepID=UPI0031FB1F34
MKLIRSYISLILLVFLLAPSAIQLSHIIAEEHHEVGICLSEDEQHYHDHDEVECELIKFHLNDFSVNASTTISSVAFAKITTPENFFYFFKSENTTSFNLRGPPSLA